MNIIIYKTLDGKEPFVEWLFSLRDKALRHRIEARIERLKNGNYGDHKRFHQEKDIEEASVYWREYHG